MNNDADLVDVELRIQARQDDGWPTELRVLGGEEYPSGRLHAQAPAQVEASTPDTAGAVLLQALLHDPTFAESWTILRTRFPARRMLIRIDPDATELQHLPWESLGATPDAAHRPLSTLATTPFARYCAGSWRRPDPVVGGPLRVLLLAPQPRNPAEYGLAPLPVQATVRAFARLSRIVPLELHLAPPVCPPATLHKWLARGFHALHILTHSVRKDGEPGALLLAGPDRTVHAVDPHALTQVLQPHMVGDAGGSLRLVTLAACDSVQPFGLALARAGIPAVLAWQDTLMRCDAAGTFAEFYAHLCTSGRVDAAANEMRTTLWLSGITTLPVLFSRLSGTQLFQPPTQRTETQRTETEPGFVKYAATTDRFLTHAAL